MTHQSAFQNALLDPDRGIPSGLTARSGADLSKRFAVYRNNVFVSLIDALADSFPVTQSLVGEEFFRAMAREFVRDNLPSSPVLTYYGDEFPNFIDNFSPANSVPYLSDIARLEYSYVVAFHSGDVESCASEQISDLLSDPKSIENLRVTFHSSADLISSKYAVASLWDAHQHEEPNLKSINVSAPESAFVIRTDLEVLVCRIDTATARFIQNLRDGNTLGEAAEDAASANSDFDLTQALSLLIRTNAFVSIFVRQGPLQHV